VSGSSERAKQMLGDMLDNAEKALRYYGEMGKGWRDDEKTIDAILRRIGNLGEAAKRMPVAERANYVQINWREIIGMRDRVIHRYDDVDLNILGEVLREDLPELIGQLRQHGIASS
jgi:uncharacterized protein with HEPN domain